MQHDIEAAKAEVKAAEAAVIDGVNADRASAPFSVRDDVKELYQPVLYDQNAGGKDNRVSSMVVHVYVLVTTRPCVPPPPPALP